MLKYNDSNFLVSETDGDVLTVQGKTLVEATAGRFSFDNVKGVCSFDPKSYSDQSNIDIYYVNFCIPEAVKNKLKDYVKGYFFVIS